MIFASALLVEDEPALADTLLVALRKLGVPADQVRHATTLQDAEASLRERTPELVLLDRALPDGDGIALCARIRADGYTGAILMLTATGQTEARVEGLRAGADDYLPKPFAWEELEARLHALSRRRPRTTNPSGEALIPGWEIDEKQLRIRSTGDWVTLTPLEFKLAAKLIRARGAILTRDELLKDVWGFTLLPKTRTVDHFLGRLRKHFEENPEVPRHFLTVRGAGYRFEATKV